MTRAFLILPLAAILGACAGNSDKAEKMQQVTVISDSICRLPERKWSYDDTPETVADARAYNSARTKKCAKKAPTS